MKKPEGVKCRDCAYFYWYAGMCESYHGFIHGDNKDCNRFVLKTKSEPGYEYYDPLPSPEIVALVKAAVGKDNCRICGTKLDWADTEEVSGCKEQVCGNCCSLGRCTVDCDFAYVPLK